METILRQKISFLLLRGLGSLIFIVAGIGHLTNTNAAASRLKAAPFADLATWMASAETLIILSGIGLLIGGFMLLLGFKTKLASAGLLAILVPITLTVQVGSGSLGPLFKNVALIGMLLFFIINGAGYYGLDQLSQLKKKTGLSSLGKANFLVLPILGSMLFLGACSVTDNSTSIQKSEVSAPANYAVLISQPNHLKAAVNTAETITKESKFNRDSFVVMACGKSVEAFKKGGVMEAEIEKGRAVGVKFMLCGMSLKQFKIDASELVDNVEITPNGLTYMFNLKSEGFITVEL